MLAKLMRLAVKHLTTNPEGESSARQCRAMARYMETEGNAEAAEWWALYNAGIVPQRPTIKGK